MSSEFRRSKSAPASTAFTLLELVVALAIAAILAVYAVPAWHAHIARAHRVDAASAVYRAAQFVASVVATGTGNEITTLPPGLDQAPQSGTAIYRLRITLPKDANDATDAGGGGDGYTIEAMPVENGPMEADACGVFVLDPTGLRSNRGRDGREAPTVEQCWNTR